MTKVSIARCENYDRRNVHEAVKRCVDLLGGIGEFVKPGMKVLLKPNLLSARVPEEGVDTHPEVVRAVVRMVKERGASGIFIGDSPGGAPKNIDEVFELSGMKKIANEEGAQLVKFTTSKLVEGIPISRYIFDSDLVISIPKLKTHSLTVLTAAIKNTFGAVVGLYKVECHSRAPKVKDFAKIVAKVHGIVRPKLNIVDAIVAMEGNGPASGSLRRMNMVMAGTDAVAIDSCIAKIIGLKPLDIHVTKEAFNLGLGEADLSRIEMVGEDIHKFITKDFKLPKTTFLKLIPEVIAQRLTSLITFKPVIDNRTCRRCDLCKLTCPVNAITIKKEFCKIDYKKCIRCMCCHEVCPYTAIDIKRNILTKVIWG